MMYVVLLKKKINRIKKCIKDFYNSIKRLFLLLPFKFLAQFLTEHFPYHLLSHSTCISYWPLKSTFSVKASICIQSLFTIHTPGSISFFAAHHGSADRQQFRGPLRSEIGPMSLWEAKDFASPDPPSRKDEGKPKEGGRRIRKVFFSEWKKISWKWKNSFCCCCFSITVHFCGSLEEKLAMKSFWSRYRQLYRS